MENNWYSNNGNENGQGNYSSDGYYTPNEKKKKGVTPAQFIVCLLAVALIFGTAGAYLGGRINKEQAPTLDSSNMIVEEPNKDDVNKTDPEASDDSVSKPENSEHPSDKLNIANDGQDSTNATGVVQNCMASVVGIYVGNTTISYATGETQEQDTGSGSGVIITDDGYIVTNNHVVQGADTIHVYLQDGTKYDAKLIGTDTFSDLAIVKIDVANLPAATIGSSGNVTVGDTVYAIGNPLGVLTSSVSKGIISGLDRTITIDGISMTLMQTDASINPGNSGGPLINMRGEVIGINTLKVTEAEGIGFAIPINIAKPIVKHFVDEGSFETPYIGIYAYDQKIATFYEGQPDIPEGVYLLNVDEAGPAYAAGLRKGDVIVKAEGQAIKTMLDLREQVYTLGVGERINLTYVRDGETYEARMNLVKNPTR